jgi:hypothetical protein
MMLPNRVLLLLYAFHVRELFFLINYYSSKKKKNDDAGQYVVQQIMKKNACRRSTMADVRDTVIKGNCTSQLSFK